jgi:hypothetical protein
MYGKCMVNVGTYMNVNFRANVGSLNGEKVKGVRVNVNGVNVNRVDICKCSVMNGACESFNHWDILQYTSTRARYCKYIETNFLPLMCSN